MMGSPALGMQNLSGVNYNSVAPVTQKKKVKKFSI